MKSKIPKVKQRVTSISVDQPMKLSYAQLRNLINQAILEGDASITIGMPNGVNKALTVASNGWSASCTVSAFFCMVDDNRYSVRIGNI